MKPFIFIPGIEATALADSNSFDFDLRWNAFDTVFTAVGTKLTGPNIEEKLQLDPLYDTDNNRIIERNHIARLPYEKTMRNIAGKFEDDPMYLFGYDWRLSNAENGKRLKTYVEYLKRKLAKENVQGFRFITHSMGALVFSCYLNELKGDFLDIDKAILCAPPFKGSPYAMIHMVKGDGGIKSFLRKIFGQNDDIRKVIRTYPSLYELCPWYRDSMVFENTGEAVDLTNPDDWQSNIGDDFDMQDIFPARIRALEEFRTEKLCDLSTLPESLRSRMMIVVGSGDKTIIQLKVKKEKGKVRNFVLLDDLGVDTGGDGTVPFQSAIAFKDMITTVSVQKENFFKEFGNELDFHGMFLRDSRVQNIIIRMMDERVVTTRRNNTEINRIFTNDPERDWWKSLDDSVEDVM